MHSNETERQPHRNKELAEARVIIMHYLSSWSDSSHPAAAASQQVKQKRTAAKCIITSFESSHAVK